jgi:undecaprenyl-diphosphatase
VRALWPALLVAAFAALMVFLFLKLGSEVVEGETQGFDQALLNLAHGWRAQHPWLGPVLRDITSLGSTALLTLFTLATVAYLWLFAARRKALLVAISIISGVLLVTWLKIGFHRARPDPAWAELAVAGMSFPSGHTSMSAIVFLTIGALIAATRQRTSERLFILASAGLLTLLVGLSRIALGVHWATDVIGGWALGSAWAVLCLLLLRAISQRG